MPKYNISIKVDCESPEEAQKVGQLLQNMVNNTDTTIRNALHKKILAVPDFFKSLLQNPFVKSFIK